MSVYVSPNFGELADDERVEEWLCLGWSINAKSKLVQGWEDPTGKERWFDKPISKFANPGQVFWVVTSNEGTFSSGTKAPRFAWLHKDDARRAKLAANSKAAEIALEQQKRKPNDELDDLIAPLAVHYKKVIGHKRKAALLAYIIEQVTS